MKTGDIVRIENSYFTNDNGLYFVAHAPGDPSWNGSDYSLRKICKNGKLSTATHNIAFWPLAAFTNDRFKNAEAKKWNAEHATIEIVENITKEYVLAYFKEQAIQARESADYYIRMWGDNSPHTAKQVEIAVFYETLVDDMEPKFEAPVTIEEKQPATAAPVERVYYPINEETARTAQNINSFREYVPGRATNGYRAAVDEVYTIADEAIEKNPSERERLVYMSQRYAKMYADYLNAYYRNEASCPSVMICGPANFPTRKKDRQNARRDTLMAEFNKLQEYKNKIKGAATNNQIKSSDEKAIEKLQDKIDDLEATKELMKAINAYYRSHGDLKDFPGDITEELQEHIDFMIRHNFIRGSLFDTSNINQEITRLKARLQELTAIKEKGTIETETDLFTIVENVELMRLQLIFDEKPDEATRSVLKSNGFKWSPKNSAWQRQLTDNAKFALKRVIKELSA